MAQSNFGTGFKSRIQEKYIELGYTLGWRLLYSPEAVLERARVAFVGLNPGGNQAPADHAEFAMESGSAYAQERWGKPPGQSTLQRQVLRLFEIVGEPLLMSWPETLCLSAHRAGKCLEARIRR